jgi:hypothetical protein
VTDDSNDIAVPRSVLPLSYESELGNCAVLTGAISVAVMGALRTGAGAIFFYTEKLAVLPLKCHVPEFILPQVYFTVHGDSLAQSRAGR